MEEQESFWDFSVRTYRTSGVPAASLSLQNDYGADVNMLLYCCWVGAYSGRFDHDLFVVATRFSSDWADNAIIPLRSARTWMKHTGCRGETIGNDDCMTLREKIKSCEFDAEQLQQDTLESMLPNAERRTVDDEILTADVFGNLAVYAEYAAIDLSVAVRSQLSVLVMAAFPDLQRDLVEDVFDV